MVLVGSYCNVIKHYSKPWHVYTRILAFHGHGIIKSCSLWALFKDFANHLQVHNDDSTTCTHLYNGMPSSKIILMIMVSIIMIMGLLVVVLVLHRHNHFEARDRSFRRSCLSSTLKMLIMIFGLVLLIVKFPTIGYIKAREGKIQS